MAKIKLRLAGGVKSPVSIGPLLTGAGKQELATAKVIGKAGEAFIKMQQRQGALSRHSKKLELKEGSNNLMKEAVDNSRTDEGDSTIRVNSEDASNLESNNKTFTEWVLSEYDSRSEKLLKGMEGNLGHDFFQLDIAEERIRVQASAQSYEARQTRQLSLEMLGDSALTASRLIRKEPFAFDELNEDFLQAVSDSKLSGIDVKKQGNRFSRMFAMEAAEGMIDLDAAEAKELFETGQIGRFTFQSMADAKEPSKTFETHSFMKHLSGDQIATLGKKADIRVSQNLIFAKSKILDKTKSHFESLTDTGEGIPNMLAEFEFAFSDQPDKIEKFKRGERTAKSFHGVSQSIKGTEIGGLEAILDSLKPKAGSKDFADQKDLHQVASKEVHRQRTLAKKDPALLVQQDFKERIAQAVESGASRPQLSRLILAMQKQKGISESASRILTNSEREGFIDAIKKSTGGQDTLDFLDTLLLEFDTNEDETSSGFGAKVMDELANADGLSPLYRVVVSNAGDRTDPNSRSTAFDVSRAIKFAPDVKAGLTSEQKTELREQTATETAGWYKAFVANRPNNISRGNELRQAIEQTAGMYMFKDGLAEADAVAKATKNLLHNKLAPDGIFSDNALSGVIVPRIIMDGDEQVVMNADNVAENLSWMKDALFEAKFGEDVLDRLDKAFISGNLTGNVKLVEDLAARMDLTQTIRIGSDGSADFDVVEGIKTIFTGDFIGGLQRSAMKNMTYQTSEDGNSIILSIQFLHQTLPILDKKGQPIEFKMTEVNDEITAPRAVLAGP